VTVDEHVRLHDVSHSFGEMAVLRDVSIDLRPGEFVSIVGLSGCGKSTLLRVLAGLQRPSQGAVFVDGHDCTSRPGQIAYLPQNDMLLPWRRALSNAAMGIEVGGMRRSAAERKAAQLFHRFGLAGFENAWPHELSGGMRQRVAVLRTFLMGQAVLAMDEPFGALDALTRRSMQQWLRGVWLENRRTTVLITHDVEEALALSTRILVLSPRPGTVIEDLPVDHGVSPGDAGGATGVDGVLKERILKSLGLG